MASNNVGLNRVSNAEAAIDVHDEEEEYEVNVLTPASVITNSNTVLRKIRVKGPAEANRDLYSKFEQYFQAAERRMKCKLCDGYDVPFPPKQSCEKLRKHLDSKHPSNTAQNGGTQAILLQGEFGDLSARNTGVYKHQKLRLGIAEFIIIREEPFRIVEDVGFKNMIQAARPEYMQVGRKTVANDITKNIYPAYTDIYY